MRHTLVPALVVAGTLAAWAINGERARATAAQSCESLASLTLPDTTITVAQAVGPGVFTPPTPAAAPPAATQSFPNLPAFCRVAAALKASSDSDIKIEVWMPASGWNGKFQAVGNGGLAGSITYSAMADGLRRGYATSSTDTGHTGESGSFALGPVGGRDSEKRKPTTTITTASSPERQQIRLHTWLAGASMRVSSR